MTELQVSTTADAVHALRARGLCVVPGVHSRTGFRDFCSRLGTVFDHRDSEASGVTVIKARDELATRPGYAAFSRAALELHTDRSAAHVPPNIIAMLYATNAGAGGELHCVDGRALYCALQTEVPNVFAWAQQPRKLLYDDGGSSYEGAIFSKEPDGTISVRFRADENGFYPRSAWPNIELFLRLAHSMSMVLRPRDGDLVLLHNGWWLHGRTKYAGRRELWRLLIASEDGIGRGFTLADDAERREAHA